jgi:hypothetical protein
MVKLNGMVLVGCCLVFICHSLWFLDLEWGQKNDPSRAAATQRINVRLPQDADGCYHVFIDVGANIGVHARFLLEPEKYFNAKIAQTIFDTEFGTGRDNRDICTFEIEPNPAHAAAHVRNAAAYQAMGWRFHYLPFAASDQDNATLDFYHQADDARGNVSEWGFSASPERKSANVEHIPTLHLSKWLDDHVRNRIIPARLVPRLS